MSIENNAAARDMLRRLLADTENKIRSAYNYGFKDGVEQGRAEARRVVRRKRRRPLLVHLFGM